MSGKIFLDTNILVYCYTNTEPDKNTIALTIAQHSDAWISTQVLQELANTLRRKFSKSWPEIQAVLDELCINFHVFSNSPETIQGAARIAENYGFSFYDSMIISACLSVGCQTLYSEDMQHGQIINNTLTISNPFIK